MGMGNIGVMSKGLVNKLKRLGNIGNGKKNWAHFFM